MRLVADPLCRTWGAGTHPVFKAAMCSIQFQDVVHGRPHRCRASWHPPPEACAAAISFWASAVERGLLSAE